MVEQTPETPPEQIQPEVVSVTPKKSPLPVILLVVLGLIIVAGAVYAGFRMGRKQISPGATSEPTVVPQTTEVTSTPGATTNWKTYKNEKYGFEFKYPEKLQFEENIYPGEKGIVYCLNFKKSISFNYFFIREVYAGAAGCFFSDFGVGGVSTDFEAGRSGGFTDTQGYEKDNGKIVFKFAGTKKFEIPQDLVKKVYTNENNVEIVVVEGKTQTDSPFQVMGTPGDGNLGALINTKNPSLTGLAVVYSKTSKLLSEDEFYQVLSTFKFTNEGDTVEGRFCGGIAANLPQNQCPEGYTCKLDGDYPDAGGKCVKN